MYEVDKGIECITDKVSVHSGHVVMVPSWPLEAQAIVMTLDINNNMSESGESLFNVQLYMEYLFCLLRKISFL